MIYLLSTTLVNREEEKDEWSKVVANHVNFHLKRMEFQQLLVLVCLGGFRLHCLSVRAQALNEADCCQKPLDE